MSAGALLPEDGEPAAFVFTAENLDRAKRIIARYPDGRQQSAVLPLLDMAQRQNENWLPRSAMDYVADLLAMPRIRVYEVASFYTMLNTAPVGRHLIQLCRTTPCWLCGSDELERAVRDKVGIRPGETSADGLFTLIEVECLGACVNAPMVQINDDYYEDLTYERMGAVLDALSAGQPPLAGSQTGRHGSEPQGGATTLKGWGPGAKQAPAQRTPADDAAGAVAEATEPSAAPATGKRPATGSGRRTRSAKKPPEKANGGDDTAAGAKPAAKTEPGKTKG